MHVPTPNTNVFDLKTNVFALNTCVFGLNTVVFTLNTCVFVLNTFLFNVEVNVSAEKSIELTAQAKYVTLKA
jgi:hypothetical protein